MNSTYLLLKAYYEALYEIILNNRELLAEISENLLAQEAKKTHYGISDEQKFNSYLNACRAFIDERIETYNPVGIQYAYDRSRADQAFELQLQLDWFNGQPEYIELIEAARAIALPDMSDLTLQNLAYKLIKEKGAYPDKSIISAYNTAPTLQKLPDFIVACAIEQILDNL